jgi:hypothetical protein
LTEGKQRHGHRATGGRAEQPLAAGEFVLGYRDAMGGIQVTRPEVLGRTETSVAFRKLYQRPIVGSTGERESFTVPRRPIRRRLQGLPPFVVTRGGEYGFMPGLRVQLAHRPSNVEGLRTCSTSS